ncbi:MAG: hypothetical protein PQ275_32650 [Elizabethkingia anophelis]|nr:MAG: hypothetical protein PQ275_32650 [Elizabethkingia anophelis]GJN61623.1 hypothetical protein ELAK_17730 [Elizabethkingia anophelis]
MIQKNRNIMTLMDIFTHKTRLRKKSKQSFGELNPKRLNYYKYKKFIQIAKFKKINFITIRLLASYYFNAFDLY